MEQYTDNQYDDDLTIGADEFGDTFQTSDVDLFEFGGDEDSPISRLKTLVLSIDWEITDEVLEQFHEELTDLKGVWADDQIRMVYLQALEKINRYIYREKSDAHPNAIKLLLGMYYNLEKIVSTEDLSERERKRLLLKDVRKFDKLKAQITQTEGAKEEAPVDTVPSQGLSKSPEPEFDPDLDDHELIDLKALVLAIDWEITEKDLLELREEVMRLEEKFSDSKPKLVFLQGIGTLATYILKKKSNAHADAFTLLHSFYDGLEKIAGTQMSLAEEKAILFPEVDKFNAFKALIAQTITPDARELSEDDEEVEEIEEGFESSGSGDVVPAFADMPEDETHGFQEEEEAALLDTDSPVQVDEHINNFFGEDEDRPVPVVEKAEVDFMAGSVEDEAEALSNAFFSSDEISETPTLEIDKELALKGVDVETEADDDSDEEALPEFNGEIAPALADSFAKSDFSADELDKVAPEEELSEELTGKLDSFFEDTESGDGMPGASQEEQVQVSAEVALQGVDVETEDDEEDGESPVLATQSFEDEGMDSSEFSESDDSAADEAPVAALFDAFFEGDQAEGGDPDPALAQADENESDIDETLPEDGLFADDDSSLEDSLDDALTAPVDKEEIASALAGYEDERDVDDIESVPAALTHLEEPEETQDRSVETTAEADEAAVAERFDALFGNGEPGEPGELSEVNQEGAAAGEIYDEEVEEFPAALSDADVTVAGDIDPALAGTASVAAAVAGALRPDVEDDEYAAVFTAADSGDELQSENAAEAVSEEAVQDELLEPLKGCVSSLALDLDDSVVQGLFTEIDSLRQQWAEKPLEKSYLQLISIVSQHIDQYRYEASAESYELLETLVQNLSLSHSLSPEKSQETLLGDTYQILQWQQNMLSRQAVSRGGQLTFLDPVRSDTEDEDFEKKVELSDDAFADDFAAELESAMTDIEPSAEGDEIDTFAPEGDETVDLDLEEALTREVEQVQRSLTDTAGDDSVVTQIVRQEIESLKKVLQNEIAELRNAIKGDS